MQCIVSSCASCIPCKYDIGDCNYEVPGWNDMVEDKHSLAREAFLEWVVAGIPWHGLDFWYMK